MIMVTFMLGVVDGWVLLGAWYLELGGRSSEAGWMTLDGQTWDAHFRCVIVQLPQSKPAKVKIVAFVAAPTRHVNYFLGPW